MENSSVRVHDFDELRYGIDDLFEFFLAFLQLFFCLFPLVNIRMQGHPADDAALRIPQRETAQLEPAGHAISTAEAALNFGRLTAFECVLPRIDRAGEIFRMKDVAAGPALQFLKCLAEIIQILLIDEFEFACGCQSM